MAAKQDIKESADRGWRRRWGGSLLVMLTLVLLGAGASRALQSVGANPAPVGFGHGLWQGALMPCTLPMLALGRDIPIYAPVNTGRGYKLGYTLGVNLCGLAFFSLFFARLSRWRQRGCRGEGTPPARRALGP